MTHVPIAQGSHSVRFFENKQRANETIADYFIQDARLDDFCIMTARAGTFPGVLQLLAARGHSHPAVRPDRIRFVNADEAIAQVVRGDGLDPERAERFCVELVSHLPPSGANSRVRMYSELADVLCGRGQHTTALQVEGFAGLLFALEPRLSILCGYRIAHFAGNKHASALRAVCGKHPYVLMPDDVPAPTGLLDGALGRRQESAAPDASTRTVYVVDDDASMRRSLLRLLTASNFRVRVFDSAEGFLEQADTVSDGCLVVDIQLGGMTGLDLMTQLMERGFSLPVIAMSGFHDERFEGEVLRLGARAFLHKPFEPQLLLDTIARATA